MSRPYRTMVHAWTHMSQMGPGQRFDIPIETLEDMDVPLDHPLDRPDVRYKIERLQRWLPFRTEVLTYPDGKKITFVRPDRAARL